MTIRVAESTNQDPVAIIKDRTALKQTLDKEISNALDELHRAALQKAECVMRQILPNTPFPSNIKSSAAIPHTGDNLRIDFETLQDDRLLQHVQDPETGIIFFGMKADGPIAGIVFQIRIPLSQLSASGINSILTDGLNEEAL